MPRFMLYVTQKTDLKMKCISRGTDREGGKETTVECRENRIIIQTLSKSNKKQKFQGKTYSCSPERDGRTVRGSV